MVTNDVYGNRQIHTFASDEEAAAGIARAMADPEIASFTVTKQPAGGKAKDRRQTKERRKQGARARSRR